MNNIESFYNFNESVRNLFEKDISMKRKYMDQVWNILYLAYSTKGGLIANGLKTPEEMLTIPYWKIDVVDEEVVAVFLYKFVKFGDKNIRKLMAIGISRENPISKLKLNNILKKEFNRSIFEVSPFIEKYFMRNFPDQYENFIIKSEEVKRILNKDITIIDEYHYERLIGNTYVKKTMFGTITERY